eukprot:TRINITY_DN4095_c0_g1_i2.p1 TRINITY_DN4095_c0_g1~~TRINITY_DN4095_c0_g1_i2.p1  ORF type:complete len:514 (-),score=128.68 TRINITY_DN4095_c0_g1_i2:246-1787(-)
MYKALPKDADGRLSHPVVRYALHRLMVLEHGWYIEGLEPDGGYRNATTPLKDLEGWVPSYFQWALEKKLGGSSGLTLRELAVMAASLEDLSRREATDLLKGVYKFWGQDIHKHVKKDAWHKILQTYMFTYFRDANLTKETKAHREHLLQHWRRAHPEVADLDSWLEGLQKKVAPHAIEKGVVDFHTASEVVEQAGLRYAIEVNDKECRDLKHFMLSKEDPEKPGRMLLSAFYQREERTASRWVFREKLDYLRDIGAADEHNPHKPGVIITNYMQAKPNCLSSVITVWGQYKNAIYDLCCRNECEDLLAHLEKALKAPTATPAHIAEVVSHMSSDTVKAPRQLSGVLLERLHKAAHAHSGQVAIHGRLFAQWMHHAFPRECPFPQEAGKSRPISPDEWTKKGKESVYATDDDMVCYIDGSCPGGAKYLSVSATGEIVQSAAPREPEEHLPWIDTEELLQEMPSLVRDAAEVAAALPKDGHSLENYNKLLGNMLHKPHGEQQQHHLDSGSVEVDV